MPEQAAWKVLYDGDCGFCKWLPAALLRRDHAGRLRPVALQRAEAAALPQLLELLPAGARAGLIQSRFTLRLLTRPGH